MKLSKFLEPLIFHLKSHGDCDFYIESKTDGPQKVVSFNYTEHPKESEREARLILTCDLG
jgi:hypothetical protein